jgi:F0F1-type ATP synthase assembly protein I
MMRERLRKISQALALLSALRPTGGRLASGPDNQARENVREKADIDRLLHTRKGLSGSEFAGIGIQFAVTIVLFAFAGIWLDGRLGSSPWFVLLMVLGGGALGFWIMVRRASGKR